MTLKKSAVGDEGGDGSQDEEESGREAGFAFSGSWRHWMKQQESFRLQRLRHKPDCSSWSMKNGETLLFTDLSCSCCRGTPSPSRICLRLSLWLWCSTSFFIWLFAFGVCVVRGAELLALTWSSLSGFYYSQIQLMFSLHLSVRKWGASFGHHGRWLWSPHGAEEAEERADAPGGPEVSDPLKMC